MIRSQQFTVTVSGTTADQDSPNIVNGYLEAIHIDFAASFGATADTTITTKGSGDAPAITLLTVTNSQTDAFFYPRVALQDAAGAGVTYDGTNEIYGRFAISDYINVAVAQATDTKTAVVTIWWSDT